MKQYLNYIAIMCNHFQAYYHKFELNIFRNGKIVNIITKKKRLKEITFEHLNN